MPAVDYDRHGGRSVLVEGRRKTWRRNFNGSALNPEYWNLIQTGAGQTVVVSGGVLTVNMNTTINSETIIQSTESFTIPFRVQFVHGMSQRIANNEVYLEMVNEAGNTYTGWMFDGTTTTNAKTVHMNGGNSNPASPSGVITINATSTTPTVREIDARSDAVDFSDRATDSTGSANARASKTRTTLDPDEKYYVRMRFKNLGTAPATNTINTLESVLIQDINDIPVEIAAGRGNNAGNRATPVAVNSMPTTNVQNSASATSGTAGTITRQAGLTNVGLSVKGSAGKVFGFTVSNPGASAAYFHLYNATTVTVGTTTPVITSLIPAGQTVDFEQGTVGMNFTTGIIQAATDTSSPMSAVAPATALISNIIYI